MKSKLPLLQSETQRLEAIDALPFIEQEILKADWPIWARENQLPPMGDWRTWLLMGGRGAGKTRAGAEWLRAIVKADKHFLGDAGGRIALVGETYQDVRSVMIEGESGLLAVHPDHEKPNWIPSRRRLEWPNGVIGQVFSANDPDGLRGNQFGAVWSDELAKWPYLDATWDMLQFCLRLGNNPRQLVTTTPRPLALLKKMLVDETTVVTRSSTIDNKGNLAPGFVGFVTSEYGGTRLGRQEINGEIIDDREDALWRRAQLENLRVRNNPPLKRIIVAVDPPATSTANADACGIVGAGKDSEGICYVLADETLHNATPQMWAKKVVELYNRLGADAVVAEVNQGGEMVETILSMVDSTIAVRPVRATRGKWVRAEPVAMLYARGSVRHVGSFAKLEDQMCDFGPDGLSQGRSPDRLDALVWALHELALKQQSVPRIKPA